MKVSDKHAQTSLSLLQNLLQDFPRRDFSVRLWDGTTWNASTAEAPRFTLVIQHPGTLRKMLWRASELSLGEAYIYDDFDIEGEMEAAFEMADYLSGLSFGTLERLRLAQMLLSLPSGAHSHRGRQPAQLSGVPHSQVRDRQAVTYHYDVSNDFYALFLDRQMVYSCAYFGSPNDDLDTAQEQKLDYICRKLRLRRGERLLDLGCGWGGLVMHAAHNYGVKALGVTLSQPQAELANERIRDAGLTNRCRVEIRDYRDVDDPEGFDKIVSVGMFEHVGRDLLEEYFRRAWRILHPGGVFLNHGIARRPGPPSKRGSSFSQSYVFPDGELVPISTTLDIAEESGFEVRDVESLREHYAFTLRHWVSRLERRRQEACETTDEVTYRIWRLFMSGSASGFQTGRVNVYQALLVKPERGVSGLPLTRADWYA